jgi:hypothetical protein
MLRLGRFALSAALALATFAFISAPQVAHAAVGDVDYALQLNGTNQYASASEGTAFVTRANYSLEGWINPSSTTCASDCTFFSHDGDYIVLIQSGYYKVYVYYNGQGTYSLYDTGVKAQANAWQHIAFTKSGSAIAYYLNGRKIYSTTISGYTGPPTYTGFQFKLGWHYSSSYFPGLVDEVRLWSVQRSDTEVVSDMHNYVPVSTSGLVAYYDLNEGSGTTLTNVVSSPASGSNLTTTSSPTFSDVKTIDTTTAPGYSILKFPRSYLPSSGGWRVPSGITSVSAVVVGGGGGGGMRAGGGGGAGGYVQDLSMSVTQSSIEAITVGQGGPVSGSNAISANYQGVTGQDSILGSHYIASGGGGGGGATGSNDVYRAGVSGGSGGGASGSNTLANVTAAVGTSTQNSYGGNGFGNSGGTGSDVGAWPAGGGGGAGGVGGVGSGSNGGKGGSGKLDPILGLCLATGGGGGINTGGTPGAGGDCGVVANPNSDTGTAGFSTPPPPLTNSGAGGGGAGWNSGGGTDINGGPGASGVIIIKYKNLFGSSVTINVGVKKSTKVLAGNQITATTTSIGTVAFYANGRIINGCKAVVVSGTTAVCNWKPLTQGQVTLTATYTSSDPLYAGTVSAPAYMTTVSKRTTAR